MPRKYRDFGLSCVAQFHETMGIDQPLEPTIPDEPVHVALVMYHQDAKRWGERLKVMASEAGGSTLLIRLQLIQEELAELAAGMISRDPVECLDALGDLSYVVDGTYLQLGLAAHKLPAIEEIHRSNMTKLGEDGKPILSSAGRIVKGPNYQPPDLAKVLEDEGIV